MARPLLDNLELQQVQEIETEQDQVLVQHGIPALEGDFFQRLDRRATQVTLTGVLTGAEVGERLKTLREKFHASQPVPFVADITTATRVDQVLIEEMGVRELAGKPARFEYAFTLREYITPPAEETEEPPQSQQVDEEVTDDATEQMSDAVEDVAENVGELRVQVEFEDGSQDFTNLVILVQGTSGSGEEQVFTIEEQTNGVYSRENVPAGEYSVSVSRR